MREPLEIRDSSDLQKLREEAREAAEHSRENLCNALSDDPMEALYALKFEQRGRSPRNSSRPLNLLEQLNQTFTVMATLAAAERLLQWFPSCGGLRLNL